MDVKNIALQEYIIKKLGEMLEKLKLGALISRKNNDFFVV